MTIFRSCICAHALRVTSTPNWRLLLDGFIVYVMAISWVLALFLWLISYKVINIDINIDIDTILTNFGPALLPLLLIVLGIIILLKSFKSN